MAVSPIVPQATHTLYRNSLAGTPLTTDSKFQGDCHQALDWIGDSRKSRDEDHSLHQSSPTYYNRTWARIEAISFSREAQFYDVHVPELNSYFAEGVFHHNSGKDFSTARIALWWVKYWQHQNEPAMVIITAPTHRQIERVIWQELRHAYLNAKAPLGGT
ncbi:MAG: hypothetical protein Q7O66_19110, partial [Dehalococcoidia bacterium]|nr:hypothetical protein [Dehalococcoidia bacterium]